MLTRMLMGVVLAIGLCAASFFFEGGHLSAIFQVSAFAIVAGGSLGFLVMSYPLATILGSIAAAFTDEVGGTCDLTLAAHVFDTLGQFFIMTGLAGCALGSALVMENLENPEHIGPGVALAVVSLFYGIAARLFVAQPLLGSIHLRRERLRSLNAFHLAGHDTLRGTDANGHGATIKDPAVDRVKNDGAA